jgi:hypothetical protein
VPQMAEMALVALKNVRIAHPDAEEISALI